MKGTGISEGMEPKDILKEYGRFTARKTTVLFFSAGLTFVLAVICICVGSSGMDAFDVIKALFRAGDETDIMIVWSIRLPRVLAAIVAGGGLAVSGCIMQNVLNNPMASPSTLGVSNAAVFGANLAIVVFGAGAFHSTHGNTLTISHPYLVTILAFICSVVSVLLILALSGRRGFSPEAIVLSGIALGSLFSAGTTIIQYFAMDTQVAAAVFWTFGDLGRASYKEVLIMAFVVAVSLAYFIPHGKCYNAMSEGDDTAKSLGIHTESTRFISLLFASMICAVCVSFLGIIGFVGLIAPQAIKRFFGTDYRYLIPASAFAGSSLLLFSDAISRSVLHGISLPVGAVTSLLGAPAFLFLLIRARGRKRI